MRRNDFVLWCPSRLTWEWHINSYEKYPLEIMWFPLKTSRHFQNAARFMFPVALSLSLSWFPVLERAGVRFLALLPEWAGMSHVTAASEASALGQETCSWPPPQSSLPFFPPSLLLHVGPWVDGWPVFLSAQCLCSFLRVVMMVEDSVSFGHLAQRKKQLLSRK